MVVAQLVERSLPTREIRGSNADIGKILSTNCTLEKMKIEKKGCFKNIGIKFEHLSIRPAENSTNWGFLGKILRGTSATIFI